MVDPELHAYPDDLPLHLSPDDLKQHIRALVRRYLHRRSPQLAQQVARCSEALALHPALRDAPEELDAFCRLKCHWRLLAAQCPAAASI